MGQSIQSGKVTAGISGSVTATVGFPAAAATQTLINQCVNSETGVTCTANTGLNLYSVTGGKTLYVTDIMIYMTSAGPVTWNIRDSTTVNTGTIKLTGRIVATGDMQAIPYKLSVPIAFSNALFLDVTSTNTDVIWWFSGYEV